MGLKDILKRSRVFVNLRYSQPVIKLFFLLKPKVRKKIQNQRLYYLQFLRKLKAGDHLAFDIGANEGFVSEIFLDLKIKVVAVEPDPRNIAILYRRFSRNNLFNLYPAAAGSQPETGKFYLQKSGTAFSTLNPKWKQLIERGNYRFHSSYDAQMLEVNVIMVDELIRKNGSPSFVKIDVEGYESHVIKGISQKIPLLVFEANLPEFIDETFACIEHLRQIDDNILFNYSASFSFGLATFVGYHDFKNVLRSVKDRSVDIICVMSNYTDYYSRAPQENVELFF